MGTLFEESECRSNPGTGEVFCDVSLDTSYQLMTQTVAPAEEFMKVKAYGFKDVRILRKIMKNYDSVYIENHYVLEAGSAGIWGQKVTNFYIIDPKAKVTHILFRGNVRQEPGRQYIDKYQFFIVNSPLVQPGMPYYNAQWEADKETQRMYEEAEKIRREADRASIEEELLRAKQEAELELQRQEEERKRLKKEKEQTGIQNLFEQVDK